MVRRGSWSRVVWRSVDFIPMKFYGVPSCLALGVGALSAGARARFSAAPPRGPPGSGGTFSGGPPVCRHRTAFQWRGPSVAEGVHAALHPPLRPVGLAAYRVPYSRPDPPMGGRGRGAGSVPVRGTSSPRRVYAPAAAIHERAPTVPGANVIGPGALHARSPEIFGCAPPSPQVSCPQSPCTRRV